MRDFQAYFTNDGSVGLYNESFSDIYHSASGALTEAYEKFIYPINWDVLLLEDEIKILDICYGIGYNTKAFLNFIFENKKKLLIQKKFLRKKNNTNQNIATIHTDNIYGCKINKYTDKIHTYNIFNKLSVTTIDNNEILVGLSPFIKTGEENFRNNNEFITKIGVEKYFYKIDKYPKINNLINFQILSKIAENRPEILANGTVSGLLSSANNSSYFNKHLKSLYGILYIEYPESLQLLNLHNIYYRYISLCYKIRSKLYRLQDFDFNIQIKDARSFIKKDINNYDLIFLDAFTPSKCPCLWSYDFFKELYSHLTPNGMLITYSSSAKIRAAMVKAGFYIGNVFNKRLNKFQGTVAAKNKALINYQLSDYDFGLLKTKAGIFYRDKNLTDSNEAIIAANKNEILNSHRMTSSQYAKLRSKHEL